MLIDARDAGENIVAMLINACRRLHLAAARKCNCIWIDASRTIMDKGCVNVKESLKPALAGQYIKFVWGGSITADYFP